MTNTMAEFLPQEVDVITGILFQQKT